MQIRRRDLHYLAKTFLLGIPAISVGIQLSTWISFAFGPEKYRADFFAYYDAGYMLRAGLISNFYHSIHPPWFGFIHPAYEAILFVPFSFLTPLKAYVGWIVVEIVIISAILRVLRSELVHLRSLSPVIPTALTLAFFPLSYAIAQGQDSVLLALLVVLAFMQFKRGNEYYAGLLLGLGVFRFQILLSIALIFVLWKSWRLLAGLFASAVCSLCLSLAMTGISGQLQYVKLLHLLSQPANQYLQQMPNLRGVLAAFGVVSQPVVLIVSGLALIEIAWLGRKLPPAHAFLFALAASSFLSYHGYLHDFSLLLLPLLVLGDLFVERADYLGLASLGTIIALPITTITIGSIMALWVCALVPMTLIVLLRFRSTLSAAQLSTPIESRFGADSLVETQ